MWILLFAGEWQAVSKKEKKKRQDGASASGNHLTNDSRLDLSLIEL